MCEECPDGIKELARRIGLYTAAHNWSTPGLHIVLDDDNHETHHIQWCLDTQDLDEEGKWIARKLLELSPAERHGVCQMASDGSSLDNNVPAFHASWFDGED